MVQDPRIAALFESIISNRLSRRQALHRAGALGLGVAASSALPNRLSGLTDEALAQEGGGEIIVGASQEAVNFNPILYANTGPETLPEVLMFDSLLKLTPEGEYIPNLATETPTRETEGSPRMV
jgi:peptide/nickel transport system substrate-binding protein